MQKNHLKGLSAIIGLFFSIELAAANRKFKDFIELKSLRHYQVSKISDVYGIFLDSDTLISFAAEKNFFYKSRYKKNADHHESFTYESYSQDKEGLVDYRFPFGKIIGYGRWLARAPFKNKGYFILGSDLKVAAFSTNGDPIAKRDIIIDRLRPPADSRGEPTRREIYAYRAKLKSKYDMVEDKSIISTGFISKPSSFPDVDGAQFIISSRIPSFTILTMKCSDTDLSFCEISRGCFLSGKQTVKPQYVTGIAYSQKRDLLFVGDAEHNRIFAYRYYSCHHIRFQGVIHLPEKIRKLSSLLIGADDSLWVSTMGKDSYLNASVYVWSSSDW